jgi:hypothetical protein
VPVAFSTFMCCIRSRTLMALFSAFQILFYRHANVTYIIRNLIAF